jgi:hypothetical protein
MGQAEGGSNRGQRIWKKRKPQPRRLELFKFGHDSDTIDYALDAHLVLDNYGTNKYAK